MISSVSSATTVASVADTQSTKAGLQAQIDAKQTELDENTDPKKATTIEAALTALKAQLAAIQTSDSKKTEESRPSLTDTRQSEFDAELKAEAEAIDTRWV